MAFLSSFGTGFVGGANQRFDEERRKKFLIDQERAQRVTDAFDDFHKNRTAAKLAKTKSEQTKAQLKTFGLPEVYAPLINNKHMTFEDARKSFGLLSPEQQEELRAATVNVTPQSLSLNEILSNKGFDPQGEFITKSQKESGLDFSAPQFQGQDASISSTGIPGGIESIIPSDPADDPLASVAKDVLPNIPQAERPKAIEAMKAGEFDKVIAMGPDATDPLRTTAAQMLKNIPKSERAQAVEEFKRGNYSAVIVSAERNDGSVSRDIILPLLNQISDSIDKEELGPGDNVLSALTPGQRQLLGIATSVDPFRQIIASRIFSNPKLFNQAITRGSKATLKNPPGPDASQKEKEEFIRDNAADIVDSILDYVDFLRDESIRPTLPPALDEQVPGEKLEPPLQTAPDQEGSLQPQPLKQGDFVTPQVAATQSTFSNDQVNQFKQVARSIRSLSQKQRRAKIKQLSQSNPQFYSKFVAWIQQNTGELVAN